MIPKMTYRSRIEGVFQTAAHLQIDEGSKIVIISDCHRGAGTLADDFAGNAIICSYALRYYNRLCYTYIELGDGDELWKNKRLTELAAVHGDIYALLKAFDCDHRLFMVFGNHDIVKKYMNGQCNIEKGWSRGRRRQQRLTIEKSVLPADIVFHEGLVLDYSETHDALLLLHGHQVDFFNDKLWRLARFLVRYVWKPLELIGFRDPTSAAKNNKVKEKIEKRLMDWADARQVPIIAGHTHRPVFPQPGEGLYFNDGSCVHPWNITALEIEHGTISLVRWCEKVRDDGAVYIGREVIAGPVKIKAYLP